MNEDNSIPPFLIQRGPDYFEYQLPVSLKMVIDYHGKVPLLKNERDEWELPGGKLELDETPEECVRREVSEELNLKVGEVGIVDSWVYKITSTRHVFIVTYGTVYHGEEELYYSSEHKELGLFNYGEIDGLKMPAPYKHSISLWKAYIE